MIVASTQMAAAGLIKDFFDDPVGTVVDETKKATDKTLDIAKDTFKGGADILKETTEAALSIPEATKDALFEGKPVDEAVQDIIDENKEAIHSVAGAPIILNQIENDVLVEVGKSAGTGVAKGLALLILPQQIANQLPQSLLDKAIKYTEGEDPKLKDVLAVPLDAALEQAHAYYADVAQPLPNGVKLLLKLGDHFTEAELNRAKFVVDHSGGSIAALINLLRTKIGDRKASNHAVAVDDIIVFSERPGGKSDLRFWAHEVQHTVQYTAKGGISGFANAYVGDYAALEADADAKADLVMKSAEEFLVALGQ